MSDQGLQSLKVIICGRSFPLKVKEDDKETLLQIVTQINKKVKEFQMTYKQKDLQDCISMVLLTYAVDLYKLQHSEGSEDLAQKIVRLDSYLDEVIQHKQAAG